MLLPQFFYTNTILQACNSGDLEDALVKNRNAYPSIQKQIFDGLTLTIVEMAKALFFSIVLLLISSAFLDTTNITISCLTAEILVDSAIKEELIFRGILQNGIFLAQRYLSHLAPKKLKDNFLFKGLTSTSFRVLLTGSIFGLIHLRNSGTYLSSAQTAAQVGRILIHPVYSIVYEKTGSLTTVTTAHVGNNLLVHLLLKLLKAS